MALVTTQRFFWDKVRARASECKYGVAFEAATAVFHDPRTVIALDEHCFCPEDRWHVVGRAENDVVIVVVCEFIDALGDDHVRIISARKATVRERGEYEAGDNPTRGLAMTEESHGRLDAESEDDLDMKPEYDFSNGIRGRFANSRFPVFIHNSILGYFHGQAMVTGKSSEGVDRSAIARAHRRNGLRTASIRRATVVRRRAPNQRFEVPRKMRLVRVTQFLCEMGEIDALRVGQSRSRVMQSKAANDPLR